jgi:hypothetical protein
VCLERINNPREVTSPTFQLQPPATRYPTTTTEQEPQDFTNSIDDSAVAGGGAASTGAHRREQGETLHKANQIRASRLIGEIAGLNQQHAELSFSVLFAQVRHMAECSVFRQITNERDAAHNYMQAAVELVGVPLTTSATVQVGGLPRHLLPAEAAAVMAAKELTTSSMGTESIIASMLMQMSVTLVALKQGRHRAWADITRGLGLTFDDIENTGRASKTLRLALAMQGRRAAIQYWLAPTTGTGPIKMKIADRAWLMDESGIEEYIHQYMSGVQLPAVDPRTCRDGKSRTVFCLRLATANRFREVSTIDVLDLAGDPEVRSWLWEDPTFQAFRANS